MYMVVRSEPPTYNPDFKRGLLNWKLAHDHTCITPILFRFMLFLFFLEFGARTGQTGRRVAKGVFKATEIKWNKLNWNLLVILFHFSFKKFYFTFEATSVLLSLVCFIIVASNTF